VPFQTIILQTMILSGYLIVSLTQLRTRSSPGLHLTNWCLSFIICTAASQRSTLSYICVLVHSIFYWYSHLCPNDFSLWFTHVRTQQTFFPIAGVSFGFPKRWQDLKPNSTNNSGAVYKQLLN
jgi:hypothetical protein